MTSRMCIDATVRAGFQHALLEYARNVLDIKNRSHPGKQIEKTTPLIDKLSCSLVGATLLFLGGYLLIKNRKGRITNK